MRRGELYLAKRQGSQDPKRQRVFVVVSRQALIDTRFSSLICAPVYSRHDLPKAMLTHIIGRLNDEKTEKLDRALATALDLEECAWSQAAGPSEFGPQPRA